MNYTKTTVRITLLFSVFLICSCGRTKHPDELVLSELIFEENGIYYNINGSTHSDYKKYTGTDTFYYDHGKIKGTYTIKDGLPNGHWEQFNADGTKKLDLYFENGNLIEKK